MEVPQYSEVAQYLMRAAGIAGPWRATACQFDGLGKTVHIWISRHPGPQQVVKRNWLGLARTVTVNENVARGPELRWRHLNCMDFVCIVHTHDVLDPRHHDLPWLGPVGMPFTNRMARQLFIGLAEGMEYEALCTMYNITFTDLWKFKFALDNGSLKFDYRVVRKTDPARQASTEDTRKETNDVTGVPEVAHPVWEHLLNGFVEININALAFQLILTKLRQQVRLQQSDEVKMLKLRELHRYVERNARSLTNELQQLRSVADSLETK